VRQANVASAPVTLSSMRPSSHALSAPVGRPIRASPPPVPRRLTSRDHAAAAPPTGGRRPALTPPSAPLTAHGHGRTVDHQPSQRKLQLLMPLHDFTKTIESPVLTSERQQQQRDLILLQLAFDHHMLSTSQAIQSLHIHLDRLEQTSAATTEASRSFCSSAESRLRELQQRMTHLQDKAAQQEESSLNEFAAWQESQSRLEQQLTALQQQVEQREREAAEAEAVRQQRLEEVRVQREEATRQQRMQAEQARREAEEAAKAARAAAEQAREAAREKTRLEKEKSTANMKTMALTSAVHQTRAATTVSLSVAKVPASSSADQPITARTSPTQLPPGARPNRYYIPQGSIFAPRHQLARDNRQFDAVFSQKRIEPLTPSPPPIPVQQQEERETKVSEGEEEKRGESTEQDEDHPRQSDDDEDMLGAATDGEEAGMENAEIGAASEEEGSKSDPVEEQKRAEDASMLEADIAEPTVQESPARPAKSKSKPPARGRPQATKSTQPKKRKPPAKRRRRSYTQWESSDEESDYSNEEDSEEEEEWVRKPKRQMPAKQPKNTQSGSEELKFEPPTDLVGDANQVYTAQTNDQHMLDATAAASGLQAETPSAVVHASAQPAAGSKRSRKQKATPASEDAFIPPSFSQATSSINSDSYTPIIPDADGGFRALRHRPKRNYQRDEM
jgi:hypothetical protein